MFASLSQYWTKRVGINMLVTPVHNLSSLTEDSLFQSIHHLDWHRSFGVSVTLSSAHQQTSNYRGKIQLLSLLGCDMDRCYCWLLYREQDSFLPFCWFDNLDLLIEHVNYFKSQHLTATTLQELAPYCHNTSRASTLLLIDTDLQTSNLIIQ